jgi:hypothetical protein
MTTLGVVAGPPVLGDTVASTSTRAEDNVRKVVKALLAVNEQVKATDVGAHLGIGKTAIYARLRGEKPFTVGEIAVLSEYFRVPVGIFYTGPEALFGNLPESGVGGRAGAGGGRDVMSSQDYTGQETRRSGSSPDQLTYFSKSTGRPLARVFSLAEARAVRAGAAA